MKKILTLALLIIAGFGCNSKKTESTGDQNQQFDQYKNAFVEHMWEIYPAGQAHKAIINLIALCSFQMQNMIQDN
ncbi:MAG: hypothetical protein IPM04_14490 [Saprospiraceae bacterium]|nr:hypothetical protein [Candidatus Brachybacter algidus]MBK8748987.1 hypothetical protein [Candidatus Brachybacter algidus]